MTVKDKIVLKSNQTTELYKGEIVQLEVRLLPVWEELKHSVIKFAQDLPLN